MKTNIFFLCVLLPLAAIVFWGCPIGKAVYPQIYFSDEFKAYTQFKVGSYWIYVDSVSDEIDSVYLYEASSFMLLHNQSSVSCDREQSFLNFGSSFYKDTVVIVSDANEYCGGIETYGGLAVFFNKNAQSIKEIAPIQIGDSSVNVITKSYYTAFFDTLTIGANTFTNLRLYTLKDMFPRTPHRSYWAKEVGIVKKYTSDNRVWELVRYHIVK